MTTYESRRKAAAEEQKRFTFRAAAWLIEFAEALQGLHSSDYSKYDENVLKTLGLFCGDSSEPTVTLDGYAQYGDHDQHTVLCYSTNSIIGSLAFIGAWVVYKQSLSKPLPGLEEARKAVDTGNRDPQILELLAALERDNSKRMLAVQHIVSMCELRLWKPCSAIFD
jgi:hypothetical protein